MKIGTDASLKECHREGYMMMEFNARELFPWGKRGPMNLGAWVHLTKPCGEWNTGPLVQYVGHPRWRQEYYATDLVITVEMIIERFLEKREAIEDFAGTTFTLPLATAWDLLNMADAVDAYCGL